mmetsp:Transcript_73609/g.204590  ORF Transcript_73609/g.204590 Transcript_73609/m.204590 type:complete len:993 (+) Transcript_73609:89-3067(+)
MSRSCMSVSFSNQTSTLQSSPSARMSTWNSTTDASFEWSKTLELKQQRLMKQTGSNEKKFVKPADLDDDKPRWSTQLRSSVVSAVGRSSLGATQPSSRQSIVRTTSAPARGKAVSDTLSVQQQANKERPQAALESPRRVPPMVWAGNDPHDARGRSPWDPKSRDAFCTFLTSKFGSLEAGWRQLDVNNNNALSRMEFVHEVARIGYRGDAQKLWNDLDPDDIGYVSMENLDLALDRALSMKRKVVRASIPDDFSKFTGEQISPRQNKQATAEDSEANAALRKFQKYMLQRFDSPSAAFEAMGGKAESTVSFFRIKEAVKQLKINRVWADIAGGRSLEDVIACIKGPPRPQDLYTQCDLFPRVYINEFHRGDKTEDSDCESEEDEGNFDVHKPDVVKFRKWAALGNTWGHFEKLFKDTSRPEYVLGFHQRCAARCEDFVNVCRIFKFDGDATSVFKEIQQLCLTRREEENRLKYGTGDFIFLKQFKLFERKARDANDQTEGEGGGSPLSCLIAKLLQLRGNLLKAWRMDLDMRGAGRVGQNDFMHAISKLFPWMKVKPIWGSMRPNSNEPLSFSDLAHNESDNLESLMNVLRDTCGLDMELAWERIDVNHQNYISLQDFQAATAKLGFKGDASAIFAGLGDLGMNRLSKAELKYMARVSRTYFENVAQRTHLHEEFHLWVHLNYSSTEEFIDTIFAGGKTFSSSNDFSARLTALGFHGNPTQTAARAAGRDGVLITPSSVRKMLMGSGNRPPQSPGSRSSPAKLFGHTDSIASPRWNRAGSLTSPMARKEAWNNRVDDISEKNIHSTQSTRTYFENAAPFSRPASRSACTPDARSHSSTGRLAAKTLDGKTPLEGRPAWVFNDLSGSEANMQKTSPTRNYFSDSRSRPVRDEIHMVLSRKNSRNSFLSNHRGDHANDMNEVMVALRKFVERVDPDGDSILTMQDLKVVLKGLSFYASDREVETLLGTMDVSADGYISTREILKATGRTLRECR